MVKRNLTSPLKTFSPVADSGVEWAAMAVSLEVLGTSSKGQDVLLVDNTAQMKGADHTVSQLVSTTLLAT